MIPRITGLSVEQTRQFLLENSDSFDRGIELAIRLPKSEVPPDMLFTLFDTPKSLITSSLWRKQGS